MDPKTEPDLLYFEDLKVGASWVSDWREVSGDDVADFAQLTGDHDPLHTDQGSNSPFGKPVAHGLLGLSILAGMSTTHPRVATLALVSLADWEFKSPVFFGDQVHVATEVESIEPHGRRACRVVWFRKLINQDNRVVQQGRFISLVSGKNRVKRLSANEEDSTQRGSLPPR
ncbi:MaoC family dehydratase [Planctomycetes bacterium K23_9]|uniref:Bifunctional protein PaaZ n=1 Tax=Stieleria marina TaxID=1930275 RepID=A0A517NR64_9BACT|nr:Bifunctional protein PaaZ [Planctomycetes bacterium K23_9]